MTPQDSTAQPPSTADPDQRWRPARDVLARRLDDAYVVVHLSSDEIFELNESGARVWELIEQGFGLEEMTRVLLREFDGQREAVAIETAELLQELVSVGLIRPV